MSKINKSRNLFLEKEELVRWDRFYQDDGLKDFIQRVIKTGGLVPNQDGNIGTNFQFEQGSDYTKIKLSQDSVAYNTLGERIFHKNQTGYEWEGLIDVGAIEESWVYIEYATSPIEEGTIVLSVNGAVTGTSTKFTEIFRGQSTLAPNKIRIYERTQLSGSGSGYTYTSKGTHEVSQVVSDTSMSINTVTALPAGTYVYSVVGAFSPGTFDDTREEEIYSYDSVNVVFSNINPTLTNDQYLLCKVTIDDNLNTQVIEDLREDFFSTTPNYNQNTKRYGFENFDYIRNTDEGTTVFDLGGADLNEVTLLPRSNYTNVVILTSTAAINIEGIIFDTAVDYGENIKIFNTGNFNITFVADTNGTAPIKSFRINSSFVLEPNKWIELQDEPEGGNPKWSILNNKFSFSEKVIDIGSWNMDLDNFITVSHGLAAWTKIRGVEVVILNNAETQMFELEGTDQTGALGGKWKIDDNSFPGKIFLERALTGFFDNTDFNDTGVNRGYVTIKYLT